MLISLCFSHAGFGAYMPTKRDFWLQIEQSDGAPEVDRLHRLLAPTEEETGRRTIGPAEGSDSVANHTGQLREHVAKSTAIAWTSRDPSQRRCQIQSGKSLRN